MSEQIGPVLTDEGGELDNPVYRCAIEEANFKYRCKHLGVYEGHYFFCSAQEAPNQHVAEGQYAYPWLGAGRQLPNGPYPVPMLCPHLKGQTE